MERLELHYKIKGLGLEKIDFFSLDTEDAGKYITLEISAKKATNEYLTSLAEDLVKHREAIQYGIALCRLKCTNSITTPGTLLIEVYYVPTESKEQRVDEFISDYLTIGLRFVLKDGAFFDLEKID